MRKITSIGILGAIFILACSGCSWDYTTVETVATISNQDVQYIDIGIGKDVSLAPYEPVTGIYLGSYVEKNTILEGSMEKYEEIIGQEQTFRVFQYNKLGDIGQVDLLKCIANKQIPYIKVLPDSSFDLLPIYELVGDLNSSYDTPIFIELLPVTEGIRDPGAYKAYYEEAYKLVKRHLSDAVIVWGIDLERADEAQIYYPGNHMVDWVGMNIYMPKYKDEKPYLLNVKEKMDFLYKSFQEDKPLMISTLAISHFSRIDHTYTVEDTKNKLNFFYQEVPQLYPRIKGILYADIDMKQVRKDGLDDYRLTSQESLITAIRRLQSQSYYLHELINENITFATQTLTYTMPVVEYEHKYYIEEAYLSPLTNTFLFSTADVISDDKGTKYYDLAPLIKDNNIVYLD